MEATKFRDALEALDAMQATEVDKILERHGVSRTRNKGGVWVAYRDIPEPVRDEILRYVQYIELVKKTEFEPGVSSK
jgi:hypothetical protein